MSVRRLCAAAVTAGLVITAACAGGRTSTPAITLVEPAGGGPAVVDVTGLSSAALGALRGAEFTADQWSALLRVAVDDEGPSMLGTYSVADGALRFTPLYPLDPGRQYRIRFDPARLPGVTGSGLAAIDASVGQAAQHTTPSTVVAQVYPTADTVPANLLRMYIEFSGPMSRQSGVPYLALLDESGAEIEGAFLPLDYEFWSPDHTRFTAFLDPGRVKDGIFPNQQLGRALTVGRSVTLVVSREWRDQHGLPLKEEFRRAMRVGPADMMPLDTVSWRVQPPPTAGRRDSLVVSFPKPLDHAILLRALGVTREGASVDGDVTIDEAETRWTFTPRDPWRDGAYELLALDILEDVAGNQIGRAFEVDNFETVDKGPEAKSITIPFTVGPASS